jgi:hypothetical protein
MRSFACWNEPCASKNYQNETSSMQNGIAAHVGQRRALPSRFVTPVWKCYCSIGLMYASDVY